MRNPLTPRSVLLFMVVGKYALHCGLRYGCVCRNPYKNELSKRSVYTYLFHCSPQEMHIFILACIFFLVWNWSWWQMSQILAQVPLLHFSPCRSINFLALVSLEDFNPGIIFLLARKTPNFFFFFLNLHLCPQFLLMLQYLEKCIFVSRSFLFI